MSDGKLRVIVLTGVHPLILRRLIAQVERACPQAQVAGVLYLVQRPLRNRQRLAHLLRQLFKEPGYFQYVMVKACSIVRRVVGHFLTAAVRFANAYTPPRHKTAFGLDEFAIFLDERRIPLLVTYDVHAEASLAFVREQSPDLGIVFGTPILKPKLFEIPRFGSVNVHQRKLPDYRGGGPVGLWELLDGKEEIGVTIHRVVKKLDAGDVIRQATIPIGPYDDLESLQLKAHVVSVDLLTDVIADFQRGEAREIPQSGPSRLYRSPSDTELRQHIKKLKALRPPYKVRRDRPAWKLAVKTVLLGPWTIVRNWRRRLSGTFPVVVFFHHLISDRPHPLGLPTTQFLRQLEFLGRYYDVVDLEVAMNRLRSGRVTSPTVVLTFDDGYRDNDLTLRAAGLTCDTPFCHFVCIRTITERRAFDHDLVAGVVGFQSLSLEEVKRLETWGFRIGSHTRTHFDCGSEDVERLREEIAQSRIELEEALGHPVPHFAYPFGRAPNMSRASAKIASRAYRVVCSAFGGENSPRDDRFEWHLYRRSHPASVWELGLAVQSLLERESIQPLPPWMNGKEGDRARRSTPRGLP